MKLIHTIEYDIIYGKITFDRKLFADDCNVMEVEFYAEPRWDNDGIGSYEYWGQKCNDKGQDYVTLEGCEPPTWDKSKYNEQENTVIEAFTNSDKHEDLCEAFCDEYYKESE